MLLGTLLLQRDGFRRRELVIRDTKVNLTGSNGPETIVPCFTNNCNHILFPPRLNYDLWKSTTASLTVSRQPDGLGSSDNRKHQCFVCTQVHGTDTGSCLNIEDCNGISCGMKYYRLTETIVRSCGDPSVLVSDCVFGKDREVYLECRCVGELCNSHIISAMEKVWQLAEKRLSEQEGKDATHPSGKISKKPSIPNNVNSGETNEDGGKTDRIRKSSSPSMRYYAGTIWLIISFALFHASVDVCRM